MKAKTIGAFEAKTHFSELLEKARQGTVFIVTRRGKPVAELGPCGAQANRPAFGSARGRVHIRSDFDAPLTDMVEYET
ncbi:MAG: type II toxin-antitoxin system Phd/YefM family antitoxin [Kiritimatiellae bacterium]|nr:type II toxin-antitoxin system Phd/YefM family antitoxin [Kiritimatiellia bacterium]